MDELALTEVSIVQMIADDAGEGINFKPQKFGGLTRSRRVRDICLAAGYVMSVQETCASDIGFAALVHLSQTIPESHLRCVLASNQMLSVKTADGKFEIRDGRIQAPSDPGLGITPRTSVLGNPVATYV